MARNQDKELLFDLCVSLGGRPEAALYQGKRQWMSTGRANLCLGRYVGMGIWRCCRGREPTDVLGTRTEMLLSGSLKVGIWRCCNRQETMNVHGTHGLVAGCGAAARRMGVTKLTRDWNSDTMHVWRYPKNAKSYALRWATTTPATTSRDRSS